MAWHHVAWHHIAWHHVLKLSSQPQESSRALAALLVLVEEGSIAPPPAADPRSELADEYSEALGWVRDADTGIRLGFPGKDLWAPSAEPEELKVDVRRRLHTSAWPPIGSDM